MNYWLVKQEPESYSWHDFVGEGRTSWTGVRNFQARNFLRKMKSGDCVIFYHSGKNASAMGLAKVLQTAYQDPTTDDDRWVTVDLEVNLSFPRPVAVADLSSSPKLQDLPLFKQSRLSVMPITEKHFKAIKLLAFSKTING